MMQTNVIQIIRFEYVNNLIDLGNSFIPVLSISRDTFLCKVSLVRFFYSTVTDLARFRGLSTSRPRPRET